MQRSLEQPGLTVFYQAWKPTNWIASLPYFFVCVLIRAIKLLVVADLILREVQADGDVSIKDNHFCRVGRWNFKDRNEWHTNLFNQDFQANRSNVHLVSQVRPELLQ